MLSAAEEALPKGWFFILFVELAVVAFVAPAVVDHLVDGTPVGEATEVAVVDEEVGTGLAAGIGAGLGVVLIGVVGVNGIEFEAALAAELDSLVKEFALADGPQDELVAFGLQFLQGCNGKWDLLANLRIFVFYNSSVKIYSYEHTGSIKSG